MSCEECIEIYEMAPSSKKPPCEKCKGSFKDVLDDNHLIIGLCEKYISLLLNGEDRVSVEGIKEVIKMESLEDIYDEVMILIPLYIKTVIKTITRRQLKPLNKVR